MICVSLGILHFVLCFCLVCLRLAHPLLPVSFDSPFLIALSVFSDVYIRYISVFALYVSCVVF